MSIKFDLKILLFLILFCFTSQLEMYLLLMLFAIIHELGHLSMGLILGFKPQEIEITPVGMKIEFKPKYEEYNQKIGKGNTLSIKRALVVIAGPLTNFLIIVATIVTTNLNPRLLINELTITIIYSNLLIAIFNLIPIYPLDGGRMIKEILHIIFGLRKSYTYTYRISKITIILLTVVSSIAIIYVQNISVIIILAYLWVLMLIERKRHHAKEKIYKLETSKNLSHEKLANNIKT